MDRLTFVYDADGTLVGEARYWVGTLFGASHCSLRSPVCLPYSGTAVAT